MPGMNRPSGRLYASSNVRRLTGEMRYMHMDCKGHHIACSASIMVETMQSVTLRTYWEGARVRNSGRCIALDMTKPWKRFFSLLHEGIKERSRREWITDRRVVRRPDIVLIYYRVRGDREFVPPEFVPLGKGDDRHVVMLEVSYAALGLMSTREAEKRKKYEDTLERLRSDGWEPVLYTLVLGTLGEMPSTAALVYLEELGIRGSELDKLLADIHMIANNKADVCIDGVFES
eukprot:1196413-Prorocentrum_minimum.AAC.2